MSFVIIPVVTVIKKQILQENLCGPGNEGSSVQYDFKVLEYVQGSVGTSISLISKCGYLMKKLKYYFSFNFFVVVYK